MIRAFVKMEDPIRESAPILLTVSDLCGHKHSQISLELFKQKILLLQQ